MIAWRNVLLACIFATGCNDYNQYLVELNPRGSELERRLTCWRESSNSGSTDPNIPPGERNIVAYPPDDLARIAKLYRERLSSPTARKHVFAGTFAETLPADVGGAGSYARFDSPLGSTTIYCERFRGEDDSVASREARYRLIDEGIDLATGWLEREVGKEPGFGKLRAFLDGPFRRDARVISDYAWLVIQDAERGRAAGSQFFARVGQYLIERGYFTARDVPSLVRALSDEDTALRRLHNIVAEKMGLDATKSPATLEFLVSPSRFAASLDRYLANTSQYAKLVAQWERERKTNPEVARPQPIAVVQQWRSSVFGHVELFHVADKVEVRLACPSRPHEMNGQWDEASRQVKWKSDLRGGIWLPALCFAAWSEPNAAAQREHFGGAVLAGEALRDYVFWYAGLSSEEAKEWDAFVESLRPDIHLAGRLKSFQFMTRSQTDAAKRLADRPRGLILQGLAQRKQER